MPTINRIRLINIKYNDDIRSIPNAVIDLKGIHTLGMLENSGGKTVLTKFMMQPILFHIGDGPKEFFEISSYFETNTQPCYVLIEWKLEGNNGFLLTGVGIKNIPGKMISKIAFIHQYKRANKYNIEEFPIIVNKDGVNTIRNIDDVYKDIFEAKKDYEISCYKNNNHEHKMAFREKLQEFRINAREVNRVLSRVNSSEGGIESLFWKQKTSKALLQDWIIPVIESKVLNSDSDESYKRTDEYTTNILKHIGARQRYSAESANRDNLLGFMQDLKLLSEEARIKDKLDSEYQGAMSNLAHAYIELKRLESQFREELLVAEKSIIEKNEELNELSYLEKSLQIQTIVRRIADNQKNLDLLKQTIKEKEIEVGKLNYEKKVQECADKFKDVVQYRIKKSEAETELIPLEERNRLYVEKRGNIMFTLKDILTNKLLNVQREIYRIQEDLSRKNKELDAIDKNSELLNKNLADINQKLIDYGADMTHFQTNFDTLKNYHSDIVNLFEGNPYPISKSQIESAADYYTSELEKLAIRSQELQNSIWGLNDELSKKEKRMEEILEEKNKEELKKQNIETKRQDFLKSESSILHNLSSFGFSKKDLYNKEATIHALTAMNQEYYNENRDRIAKGIKLQDRHNLFANNVVYFSQEVSELFSENHISFEFGMEWIRRYSDSIENKKELLRKCPLIPYSLIVSEKDIERAKKIVCERFTDFVIPLIDSEKIDSISIHRNNSVLSINGLNLFIGYNEELIDEQYIEAMIKDVITQITDNSEAIDNAASAMNKLGILTNSVQNFFYHEDYEKELTHSLKASEDKLNQLSSEMGAIKTQIDNIRNNIKNTDSDIEITNRKRSKLSEVIDRCNILIKKADTYFDSLRMNTVLLEKRMSLTQEQEHNGATRKNKLRDIDSVKDSFRIVSHSYDEFNDKYSEYLRYDGPGEILFDDAGILKDEASLFGELKGLSSTSEESNASKLRDEIAELVRRIERIEAEIQDIGADYKDYSITKYSYQRKKEIGNLIALISDELSETHKQSGRLDEKINADNDKKEKEEQSCIELYNKPFFINYIQADGLSDNIRLLKKEIKDIKENKDEKKISANDISNFLKYKLETYKDVDIDSSCELADINLDNYESIVSSYINVSKNTKKNIDISIEKMTHILAESNKKYGSTDTIKESIRRMNMLDKISSSMINEVHKRVEDRITTLNEINQILVDEFDSICSIVVNDAIKLYQELKIVDKSARIGGVKYLELKISNDFSEESVQGYLKDVINSCIDKPEETQKKIVKEAISGSRILDAAISFDDVKIRVLKINVNDKKMIPYENSVKFTPGYECSGAQGTIISFIILQTMLRYGNEGISEGKEISNFMIIDNPFSALSSPEFVRLFFKIADVFQTQLFCFTDLRLPHIVHEFSNIYSIYIVKRGNNKELLAFKNNQPEAEEVDMAVFEETHRTRVEKISLPI